MTKYKLHYFDVRGRAECIRYLFHFTGTEFEDYRFTIPQWVNKDESIPFELYETNKTPLLEVTENGQTFRLFESVAICRFLAKRFKLTGKTEYEEALCDQYVDALQEPLNAAVPAYYSDDNDFREKTHQRILTDILPRVYGYLEKRLLQNGGKRLVGDGWTWADFALCWTLRGVQDYAKPTAQAIEDNYPQLAALARSVEQLPAIAAYIAKRPVTNR